MGQTSYCGLSCIEYSPNPVVLILVSKPKNVTATMAAPSENWTREYAPSEVLDVESALIDACGYCTVLKKSLIGTDIYPEIDSAVCRAMGLHDLPQIWG